MIPFGSCGLAQDVLRSCYRGVMRPFSDDDTEIPVYWYFTDKKAPFLPVPSAFVSANWDAEPDYVASIGEGDRGKRKWANGRTPPWVRPAYFGPAAAWLDGIAKAESVVTVLNIDGSDPRCTPGGPVCLFEDIPDTLWVQLFGIVFPDVNVRWGPWPLTRGDPLGLDVSWTALITPPVGVGLNDYAVTVSDYCGQNPPQAWFRPVGEPGGWQQAGVVLFDSGADEWPRGDYLSASGGRALVPGNPLAGEFHLFFGPAVLVSRSPGTTLWQARGGFRSTVHGGPHPPSEYAAPVRYRLVGGGEAG